ncbi:bifunctional hydroxymethylpyrimidine kinase/phosphomethylpyrimidine kinase [Oenococcus alcoholitolerans]|uniref:bifunctional hydroxymethylpyrimidine kinase/phosphomethylpyrimidine kinase n=1 Tax=Oenococcus alcoholitolerans TaxID=931074 RepID=UPI003F716595
MKTFFARKVYGTSVLVTSLAANHYGVKSKLDFPLKFISDQFDSINQEFEIDAVKTGFLSNYKIVDLVARKISQANFGFCLVDPVMVSKHGVQLLDSKAVDYLTEKLIPLADLVTPNFFEAEKFFGQKIKNREQVEQAARKIKSFGCKNVIIKGFHQPESQQKIVSDYILLENEPGFYLSEKFSSTKQNNGSGDTFSSIIIAEIAKGKSLKRAIQIAKRLTFLAISNPIKGFKEFGAINHWEII